MRLNEDSSVFAKTKKIILIAIFIRALLYLPIYGIELDILKEQQLGGVGGGSLLYGIQNISGSSYLSIGYLSIVPYINASLLVQLLTPILPYLENLQKENQREITKVTRYITLLIATGWSTYLTFTAIKPVVFNWNFTLAIVIITQLIAGSMLCTWGAESISKEKLANGTSIIISIDIIGGFLKTLSEFKLTLATLYTSEAFIIAASNLFSLLILTLFIVKLQTAEVKVEVRSAKQQAFFNTNSVKSFLPLRLLQVGSMPIIWSRTLTLVLASLLQGGYSSSLYLVGNFLFTVIFNIYYTLITLKPKKIAKELQRSATTIKNVKPGPDTVKYLESKITVLATRGGVFLASLTAVQALLDQLLKVNICKNLFSFVILINVCSELVTEIRSSLLIEKYKNFK
jgi:preprotein translocase subunit SecY